MAGLTKMLIYESMVAFSMVTETSAAGGTTSIEMGRVRGFSRFGREEQGGLQQIDMRMLLPHGHGGHSSHSGCLNYTDEELSNAWAFKDDAPSCSFVYTEYSNDDDEGNGGGGGGDGGGGGTNGGSGSNGDGSSYQVVVSNEDFTSGTYYDPYEAFNISQCETYTNLWMWDLSLSCYDEVTFDSCNCTFAQELYTLGFLACEDAVLCPDDCPICSTCMTMVGCGIPIPILPGSRLSTSFILYIILAAVLLLILILAGYHLRRRSQEENDLKKNLMAEQAVDTESQAATMISSTQQLGWEPPPEDPAQFGPSVAAASVAAGLPLVGITRQAAEDESDANSERSGGGESDVTIPTIDETTIQTEEHEGSVAAFPADDTQQNSSGQN